MGSKSSSTIGLSPLLRVFLRVEAFLDAFVVFFFAAFLAIARLPSLSYRSNPRANVTRSAR